MGAGCRAVNELVSRALFIGREIIPCGTIFVNTSYIPADALKACLAVAIYLRQRQLHETI